MVNRDCSWKKTGVHEFESARECAVELKNYLERHMIACGEVTETKVPSIFLVPVGQQTSTGDYAVCVAEKDAFGNPPKLFLYHIGDTQIISEKQSTFGDILRCIVIHFVMNE